MKQVESPKFTSFETSHKAAVEEVLTILEYVQEKGDKDVVALIDGILGDLISGAEKPKEALSRARTIRDSLNFEFNN